MSSPLFDALESRVLFAARPPTAEETYLVELINRARTSPAVEALRFGTTLNEGLPTNSIQPTPKPPLAINQFLTDASYLHALYLVNSGQVSFVGQNGTLPMARAITAGYTFTGTPNASAESLTSIIPAAVIAPPTQAELDEIHRLLFTDTTTAGRTDRINMLAAGLREVAATIANASFGGGMNNPNAIVAVYDYGTNSGNAGGDQFLTGVAYNDANANNFYDIGEGLGNITITARRISDNVTFSTTSFGQVPFNDLRRRIPIETGNADSGAYSLRLPSGTYDVIASGTGLTTPVRFNSVVVGGTNVKRDFTPQQSGGAIPNPGTTPAPIVPNPSSITGDLKGRLFVDKNGDGRRSRDVDTSTITGLKVYVDTDKDGVRDTTEPFGLIRAGGVWEITGITPGVYHVTVETPAGFRISEPKESFKSVVVTTGKQKKVPAFLVTQRTIISGTVYRDDNGNGTFDTALETGRKGFRVFVDLNNDSVWQKDTEPSRVTSKTGAYAFRDLLPATYTVRIIPRVGYLQTEPASNGFYVVNVPADGLSVIGRDFGVKLIG
jgi:hypothetical protein